MSEQDNIRLAEEYVEAMNSHDYARVRSCHGEGFQSRFPGYPEPLEGAVLQAFFEGTWTAFPDFTMKIDRTIAQGDYVVTNWTCTGTHDGPLRTSTGETIPATGHKIVLSGSATMEFKDGTAAWDQSYWDSMGLLRQLGVMPGA